MILERHRANINQTTIDRHFITSSVDSSEFSHFSEVEFHVTCERTVGGSASQDVSLAEELAIAEYQGSSAQDTKHAPRPTTIHRVFTFSAKTTSIFPVDSKSLSNMMLSQEDSIHPTWSEPDVSSGGYQEEAMSSMFMPLLSFHESKSIDMVHKFSKADVPVTENQDGRTFPFTIPHDILIQVYGFDPRTSPFAVNGYPLLPSMTNNLDHLYLPLVEKKHLKYARKDDGLFDYVGQGRFGCVFVAKMEGYECQVAVKDFINENVTPEMIEREAKLLTYLSDTGSVPEFVGLLVSSASSARYSLVQEYFGNGTTVHKLLVSKERLSRVLWIKICYKLAVGLDRIHAKHVLLNDVKSDNVLVDLDTELPDVRYIDMGMASYREGLRFEVCSHMDQYRHLAPEVCMGSYTSPLSDIYSLGYLLGQIGRKCRFSEIVNVSEVCLKQLPIDRISLKDLKARLVQMLKTIQLD